MSNSRLVLKGGFVGAGAELLGRTQKKESYFLRLAQRLHASSLRESGLKACQTFCSAPPALNVAAEARRLLKNQGGKRSEFHPQEEDAERFA